MTLNGPAVLVTGAAARIGAEIAKQLHAAGLAVLVHFNQSKDAAEALVTELNSRRQGSATAVQADLCDADALQGLADATIANAPGLIALVNNASNFEPASVAVTSRSLWSKMQASNAEAPFFLSQALLQLLRKNTGCIVNITDVYAQRPLKNYAAYCASKAALLSVTRSLALECAPDIRVNAVAPGVILWPSEASEEFDAEFDAEKRQQFMRSVPMQRIGKPGDIASAVRYLILDAPYVTGEVMHIDGGQHLSG